MNEDRIVLPHDMYDKLRQKLGNNECRVGLLCPWGDVPVFSNSVFPPNTIYAEGRIAKLFMDAFLTYLDEHGHIDKNIRAEQKK